MGPKIFISLSTEIKHGQYCIVLIWNLCKSTYFCRYHELKFLCKLCVYVTLILKEIA